MAARRSLLPQRLARWMDDPLRRCVFRLPSRPPGPPPRLLPPAPPPPRAPLHICTGDLIMPPPALLLRASNEAGSALDGRLWLITLAGGSLYLVFKHVLEERLYGKKMLAGMAWWAIVPVPETVAAGVGPTPRAALAMPPQGAACDSLPTMCSRP